MTPEEIRADAEPAVTPVAQGQVALVLLIAAIVLGLLVPFVSAGVPVGKGWFLSPRNLPLLGLSLMAGAPIGILIGAVPGLEPAGAMAILLPFTLNMTPLAGVTLLLGTYGGARYGDAIPAILLRVPGTPANVLTTYDGYPMVQMGLAHRELSIAYSFIGGTASIVALIVLAPYLAKVAEHSGAPEYAMVAVVAIISVVLAHQKQGVAAVMALGLGLFLGSVGFDGFFNTQRFTFGQTALMGGIPLIPAVIGLFAMSQAFVLLEAKGAGAINQSNVYHHRFTGLIEAFKYSGPSAEP